MSVKDAVSSAGVAPAGLSDAVEASSLALEALLTPLLAACEAS